MISTPLWQNPQILSFQTASSPPLWVQSAIQWGPSLAVSWGVVSPDLLGSGVPSQDFLPLQSPEARQAGSGQYWGAGAPDLPGASSLVWDFICWTYFCVCEHFTLLF